MSLANGKLKKVKVVLVPNERVNAYFDRGCGNIVGVLLGVKFTKTLPIVPAGVRRAHVEGKAIAQIALSTYLRALGRENAVTVCHEPFNRPSSLTHFLPTCSHSTSQLGRHPSLLLHSNAAGDVANLRLLAAGTRLARCSPDYTSLTYSPRATRHNSLPSESPMSSQSSSTRPRSHRCSRCSRSGRCIYHSRTPQTKTS
jgi:hypothetical protein